MFIHAAKETIQRAMADLRPLMLKRGTVMLGHADSIKGECVLEIPGVTIADVRDRKWFPDAIAVYDAREPAKAIVDQWRAERTKTDEPRETGRDSVRAAAGNDTVAGGDGNDE